MAIAFKTPDSNSIFAHLEACQFTVRHSPWLIGRACLRGRAPLVLAGLSVPWEVTFASALLWSGDVLHVASALEVENTTVHLRALFLLASIAVVPIEAGALSICVVADSMSRAGLSELLEVQPSKIIVVDLVVRPSRKLIARPISLVHVAGPRHGASLVLAGWAEKGEAATALSWGGRIVSQLSTLAHHKVGSLKVALHTVTLEVANATKVFRTTFEGTILAIEGIATLADTNSRVANPITIAFQLTSNRYWAALLFAGASIEWRLANTVSEIRCGLIVRRIWDSIVTMECTVEWVMVQGAVAIVCNGVDMVCSSK